MGGPQTPAPQLPAPFSSPTCSTHASCFAPEIQRPCLTWAACPAPPSPGVGSMEPPGPPGRPLPALGAAVRLLAGVSSSLSLAGRSPREAEGTGLGRASWPSDLAQSGHCRARAMSARFPLLPGAPPSVWPRGTLCPGAPPAGVEVRKRSAPRWAPPGQGAWSPGAPWRSQQCSGCVGEVPCVQPGPEGSPLSCWPVTGSPDFRPLGICERKDPALGLYWDGGHGIKPRLLRAGPSSASPCGLLRGAHPGEGGGGGPLSNHN